MPVCRKARSGDNSWQLIFGPTIPFTGLPHRSALNVMNKYSISPTAAICWLALAVLCLGIATVGKFAIEHQMIYWGRLVCPAGWWRSSPGICAFPPVSITILATAYGVVSALLLTTTVLLAPSHKLKVCILIIVALGGSPTYALIFKGFSWVALASLCAVIGIAMCFSLGAVAMRGHSFHRTCTKSRAGKQFSLGG